MKNSITLKIILGVLGLLLTVLGSWRLMDPITFFENSGLILSPDAGIMSEARGTGGVVTGFGILVFLGAFNQKLSLTSTIVASILFLMFGFSRLIGMGIDGFPGNEIVRGIIFEFVLGSVALIALFKYRAHD